MPQVQQDRHGTVAGQLRDADANEEGRVPELWQGGEAEGGRVGAEAVQHQSLRVREREHVEKGTIHKRHPHDFLSPSQYLLSLK